MIFEWNGKTNSGRRIKYEVAQPSHSLACLKLLFMYWSQMYTHVLGNSLTRCCDRTRLGVKFLVFRHSVATRLPGQGISVPCVDCIWIETRKSSLNPYSNGITKAVCAWPCDSNEKWEKSFPMKRTEIELPKISQCITHFQGDTASCSQKPDRCFYYVSSVMRVFSLRAKNRQQDYEMCYRFLDR